MVHVAPEVRKGCQGGQRLEQVVTSLHAVRAGVLKDVLGVGAGDLSLPGIGEGSSCALHHPTEGCEVIGLVLVVVPTQA